MEKIDYTKEYKEFYHASAKAVQFVTVPPLQYLTIQGQGNPNTAQSYKDAVQALFNLAYTIKFMIKKGAEQLDYGVLPLEGLWWTENMEHFTVDNKDIWQWKAMIMQPTIVTKDHVDKAIAEVTKKKNLPALSRITFESYEEGQVAQIMHIGAYADEKPTIDKLHAAIIAHGGQLHGLHHEIYLSDPARTASDKLKTILRQPFIG